MGNDVITHAHSIADMVSSSSHLTYFTIRYAGINDKRKFKNYHLIVSTNDITSVPNVTKSAVILECTDRNQFWWHHHGRWRHKRNQGNNEYRIGVKFNNGIQGHCCNNFIQDHCCNTMMKSLLMRKGSWAMASASSHLTNLSIRHIGINYGNR
jgi:hypothetical protein